MTTLANLRELLAAALLVGGLCSCAYGLLAAYSGLSPFLIYAPAPFTAAALLSPTNTKFTYAAAVWLCWLISLSVVLTQ